MPETTAKPRKRNVATVAQKVQIADSDILLVTTLEQQVKQAEETLKRMKGDYAKAEASLCEKLKVEHEFTGQLKARLDLSTEEGKFSPKWKEEYVAHMTAKHGKSEESIEADMRKKYPPKEKTVETLVIIKPTTEQE